MANQGDNNISQADADYLYKDKQFAINIEDPTKLKEVEINGYIHWFLTRANKHRMCDGILWSGYTELFEDWSSDIFKFATNSAISELRKFLRLNGVYCPQANHIKYYDSKWHL